jgi:hypothetical protein
MLSFKDILLTIKDRLYSTDQSVDVVAILPRVVLNYDYYDIRDFYDLPLSILFDETMQVYPVSADIQDLFKYQKFSHPFFNNTLHTNNFNDIRNLNTDQPIITLVLVRYDCISGAWRGIMENILEKGYGILTLFDQFYMNKFTYTD